MTRRQPPRAAGERPPSSAGPARPPSGRLAPAPPTPAAAAAASGPPRRRRSRRRAAAGGTTPRRPVRTGRGPRPPRAPTRPGRPVRSAAAAAARPAARPAYGTPVPVASTSPPAGSPADSVSAIRRVSTAIGLVESGDSALRPLPAVSRDPTRPGTRGMSAHARTTRSSQRRAWSRVLHASNASVGTQIGSPSASARVASSPAAPATSISSAVTRSVVCSSAAAARRSRTPSPPLRSSRAEERCPTGEEELDPVDRFEAGTGRGPVDEGRPRAPTWRRRRRAGPPGLPRRATVAERNGDHAREDDPGPAATRHEQPARQQLLGGGLGVLGRDVAPRRAGVRLPAVGDRRARAWPAPAGSAPPAAPAPSPGPVRRRRGDAPRSPRDSAA